MDWPYRYFIIVPDEARSAANFLSQIVDPDIGGGDAFSIPLGSDGETITHWGCNTLATEAVKDALEAHAGNVPGYQVWRRDSQTRLLQVTNVAASQSKVGEVFTWHQALQDAGLGVIQPAWEG